MSIASVAPRVFVLAISVAIIASCGKSHDKEGAGSGAKTIRVTGIPLENPAEIQRKAQPLVDYLHGKLGANVEYVPVTDYGAAVQALSAGKVDFAFLGGFTYVQAHVMSGVVPLFQRDIDRDFKSLFIANVDSGITSPADLKGKSFAFGSKSSTSGHLMPRYFLTTQFKIDPEKDFAGSPVFSGAHDATAKMVESGKVQAGALDMQVWDRLVKNHQIDTDKVKVIWTTPGFVDYVWTARKDVDPALRDAFTKAFLDLDANNPEHAAVLKLQGAAKYVPCVPADFDKIEEVARSTGLLTGSK